MIHPNASATSTVRNLFVIDPDKRVRLVISYQASTGRNFNEVLRVIDSLQLTDKYPVVTPADWQVGQEVIVAPSVTTPDARVCFPQGVRELRPYLRYTDWPAAR
jgi:alkyl hydroperoxide reductase subunit AhpC